MRHIRITNTKILCFKKSNLLADVKLSLKPNMTSWATRMYKMAFESSCWASKAFQIKSETEYVNSGATCIRIKFFGSEINYKLLEPQSRFSWWYIWIKSLRFQRYLNLSLVYSVDETYSNRKYKHSPTWFNWLNEPKD